MLIDATVYYYANLLAVDVPQIVASAPFDKLRSKLSDKLSVCSSLAFEGFHCHFIFQLLLLFFERLLRTVEM